MKLIFFIYSNLRMESKNIFILLLRGVIGNNRKRK